VYQQAQRWIASGVFAAMVKDLRELLRMVEGREPKRYKPIMVATVIEAIESGELKENRIAFDWLLPRFLERAEALNIDAGPDQARWPSST
jgi:hypothetical protein